MATTGGDPDDPRLEAFGALLMERVRDVTVREWDSIIDGRAKSANSRRSHQQLQSFTPEQIETLRRLVPKVVDTTLHYFLYMLEDEQWVSLALESEAGIVPDARRVAKGDLQGYLPIWSERFSNTARPGAAEPSTSEPAE